ncbi:uncharacterized protein LOC118644196 [Monomorium pharaonis]|uniref:uncharacterized protein LOC105831631 n=1 Tax=Monomorium pharaonis TaxID=307658 RepID=UPI0017478D7E|nr:uncharacterized protein LOC105831631 [Monomorium pharaonis]XP_036150092.1 uncharacterized protein LOC118644196 [Monomorium pharaonis]
MVKIHMPDDNSLSIEHTLQPIVYTSWFLGVGVAHPRKYRKIITIIIRIVHFVICTLTLTLFSLNVFDHDKFHYDEFSYIVETIIYYVSAYYYIYHGIRHYDKWPELMDKIKDLDQKIKRETHINERHLKNLEVVAITATFVCCTLLPTVYNLYNFLYLNDIVVQELLAYYMLAQSLINSFVFDVVVYILYYRYQMINKLLGQLDELSDTPGRIALKIKRIRQLHCDICDLVVMVNSIHGLHLLFVSINCFSSVSTATFFIYSNYYKISYTVLKGIFFLTMYTTQFGLMCWICTLARQEFDKTGAIISTILLKCKSVNLDKLNGTRNQLNLKVRLPMKGSGTQQRSYSCSNLNYTVEENFLRKYLNREWSSQNLDCVRNEINDFNIQLQHRRVAFIACNFFEINNSLFNKFIGVITASVALMINVH